MSIFVSSRLLRSPSKVFAMALGAFALGVLVAPAIWWRVEMWTYVWIAAAGIAAAAIPLDRRARVAALLVGLCALGVWRYGLAERPSDGPTIADAAGRSVRVSGTVVSEVSRASGVQRAVLGHLSADGAGADGRLLVRLDPHSPVEYGDRVSFDCRPERPEPFDGFAYDRYLRAQGILALCSFPRDMEIVPPDSFRPMRALLSVKRAVVARLGLVFPEPHAAFLSGLLFGGNSALSDGLKEDFSRTGTAHILAASGFNVSLFSLVFLRWITHTILGRRRGAALTAALLVAYVLLAGATAAVVRAGIMGLLVLLGFVIRRKPSILNVLLLTLAAMLAANPLLLLDDVGFQLSFVATAAMLWLSGPIEKRCVFVPEAFGMRASFAGSLAAIVATSPLMLWHFGGASPVSPLVNLLVLPLVPILMALSGIALAAGFLHPVLGTVVGLPAWAVSSVVLHLVAWFGG